MIGRKINLYSAIFTLTKYFESRLNKG